MTKTDTNNTGYTIHRIKVRENRIDNQVWTIQTPTILGTQYTEQRLEKTEGAIKIEQSRNQQHCANNAQNNG